MDKLDHLVELQSKLMKQLRVKRVGETHDYNLKEITPDTIGEYMTPILFALNVEVGEVAQELNWKPWKKSMKQVNAPKVHEELVDCLFFVLELMIMMGLTAEDVHTIYANKLRVNLERQANGY